MNHSFNLINRRALDGLETTPASETHRRSHCYSLLLTCQSNDPASSKGPYFNPTFRRALPMTCGQSRARHRSNPGDWQKPRVPYLARAGATALATQLYPQSPRFRHLSRCLPRLALPKKHNGQVGWCIAFITIPTIACITASRSTIHQHRTNGLKAGAPTSSGLVAAPRSSKNTYSSSSSGSSISC